MILWNGPLGAFETKPFNNGTNKVLDIIKTVCGLKLFKLSKLIKKTKSRIGQDLVYKLGSIKTRRALGWKPIYSLEKGLNEIDEIFIKHYGSIPSRFIKNLLSSSKHRIICQ